jgi:spermidine synthase
MKAWTLLDHTVTPDGKKITLHEHDGAYAIRVDGSPLMTTRQHASEERLAELACAHVQSAAAPRVLIGGLGFGFTLRAALRVLPAGAAIVVAEILAAVIEWNRNPEFPLAADAIADQRVTIVQRDVGVVIRESRGAFDAIVLDVDNGPAAMSTAANERLYDFAGLERTRCALRPAGCAAFWSAAPAPDFAKLMARAGFRVEIQRSRARGNAGARHTIFLGWKGEESRPRMDTNGHE